ncbi:Kinesin-like protein KIN-UB [Vitis vinifera]|uniref:Vacuolar protein 8 n=1 Tax=Vitis vinifera TaxID=29760 RepID=A0A438K2A9_VITVI|nr:Kinesin-like protein KIN-UB [Vitis vinifera]
MAGLSLPVHADILHIESTGKCLGTARTSLVVTIGPSPRHRGETSSTIMFGQRAMKVENMLKIKEEFDYKSLSRRLEIQLDKLIVEHERQQKAFEDEVERITVETQNHISETERNYADALEKERLKYQEDYMQSIKKLEEQWVMNQRKHGSERTTFGLKDDNFDKTLNGVGNGGGGSGVGDDSKGGYDNASGDHDGYGRLVLAVSCLYIILLASRDIYHFVLRGDSKGTIRYSNLLRKVREGYFISSFKVGGRSKKGVEIFHLLFIDDILLFWKVSTTYLGLPLASTFKSPTVWDVVEERFNRRKGVPSEISHSGKVRKRIGTLVLSSNKEAWVVDVWEVPVASAAEEIAELKKLLQNEASLRTATEEEVNNLKSQVVQWKRIEAAGNSEILKLRKMLEDEAHQKEKLEEEIAILQSQLFQLSFEADETSRQLDRGGSGKVLGNLDSFVSQIRHSQLSDSGNGDKASIAKLFEQVGLQKILSLLEAEDADVRIHAVKVVANLAAEETNQEKIVEAGGLSSLLMLLRSSEDETIQRVAAGAIANLAMNETNQELIMSQGGISLLSITATHAEDPQTLRMVAGAIANLCGNDKLQIKLRGEGGIKALLGMVRCGHPDVLAQVARGIANFAKCESRASSQGTKSGRSLLIEDGALPWIVQNANNEASPIRRHIELALCHLAQHEVNAKDMISGGALWELVRISRDCSREDIRTLAHRTLNSSPTFQTELRRLRIEC